jgi:hypothetical protein
MRLIIADAVATEYLLHLEVTNRKAFKPAVFIQIYGLVRVRFDTKSDKIIKFKFVTSSWGAHVFLLAFHLIEKPPLTFVRDGSSFD